MAALPLTRSKHLLPFSSLVQKAGAPINPLLRQSRLPSNCLDDPESLVPSDAAFRFRALAARKLGLPDLALEATRHLEIADLGEFGEALFRAPTLFRLLTKFQELINTQTTMAQIQIEQEESGDVSFCHQFHYVPEAGVWQTDLYIIGWTIKLVRLVEPGWSPAQLWSVSPEAPGHSRAIEQLGVKMATFGRHCTGFRIPLQMLALPLTCNMASASSLEDEQLRTTAPAETFYGGLGQVIKAYAEDRWLTIDEVAEVIDMSSRSLQRRLSAERTTYSAVFEGTRSQMAGELLETTDVPIADIARRLGYQNQGNLTRAFKRWSGVSPSVYRQQRQAE